MYLFIQTILAISLTVISLANSTAFGKSKLKFASAHTVALDGIIPEGKILSRASATWMLESEIKQQLMYTIGQLNGLEGGSPDMNRFEVKVGEISKHESGLNEVSYTAKLFIAWPIETPVPTQYELKIPTQGTRLGLETFTKAYGSDENSGKRCLDWGGHDITQDIFWYYYRPEKLSCPLNKMIGVDPLVATTTMIHLSQSDKNTTGKFPEYDKVWEDGKLVITAIFGMANEEAPGEWDAGVRAYKDTVNSILKKFGTPKTTNIELKGNRLSKALGNNEALFTFDTEKGEVDVALYLIKGIRVSPYSFRLSYNQRTKISDYISYSGHSGLGANIRALAAMGKFAKNQYQIFLINGCDTFAYVDNALRDAHQSVNPKFGKDKFVDVITNAMPSYFHMNNRTNMAIVDALFEQTETYEEILSKFDKDQRAVVTGEEDNNWPMPFID